MLPAVTAGNGILEGGRQLSTVREKMRCCRALTPRWCLLPFSGSKQDAYGVGAEESRIRTSSARRNMASFMHWAKSNPRPPGRPTTKSIPLSSPQRRQPSQPAGRPAGLGALARRPARHLARSGCCPARG